MMAQEAYARLSASLGEERVGLVTGEERINDGAAIIACTTEMTPRRTHILVLDEAHWLADPDRGSAWTSALLGTDCDELHLVGSYDVAPLLALTGMEVETRRYERFVPLEWAGEIDLRRIEPSTIVVAFSRAAVYALARDIGRANRGRSVGVLYGAMPLPERRRQIDAFVSGDLDVIVSTDVLGHGVNLPARTVIFAESTKFDGHNRRNLEPWEVAQIAGRAGRYGFQDKGLVGILSGSPWSNPDEKVIRAGLSPSVTLADGTHAFRSLDHARLGPSRATFADLDPRMWARALEVWEMRARRIAEEYPWISIADVSGQRARLAVLGAKVLGHVNASDAWSLVHAPFDVTKSPEYIATIPRSRQAWDFSPADDRRPDPFERYGLLGPGALLRRFGAAVISPSARLDDILDINVERLPLEGLERAFETIIALRWFALRWPKRGAIATDDIAGRETAILTRISHLVSREVSMNKFGICQDCGGGSAPWFSRCDSCHSQRNRRWREDAYGEDGHDEDE